MLGILMLIAPVTLFVLSIPLSARLTSGLRRFYLIFGAIVVFIGSGTSFYFASYSGDQGGIAAYFFQTGVIFVYLLLLIAVVGISLVVKLRSKRSGV
jgi:hypothetical protein